MAKDLYSQIAYLRVVESAQNTLTFAGLSVFSNVLSQQGMLIHRVEYTLSDYTMSLFVASADGIGYGIVGDDQIDSISLGDPRIYDGNFQRRTDAGTAANAFFQHAPKVVDFSGLPGGGKLCPADRIFGYILGSNLSGVGTVSIRVHFTLLEMSASDYLELAQSLRVLR